jgi:hypothetical protein
LDQLQNQTPFTKKKQGMEESEEIQEKKALGLLQKDPEGSQTSLS